MQIDKTIAMGQNMKTTCNLIKAFIKTRLQNRQHQNGCAKGGHLRKLWEQRKTKLKIACARMP